MKKSLLALAVLGAFADTSQAQSSVTIYGSFDGGVRNQTNVNAAGDSRLTMGSNGTYYSNRLGFKGVEDLGGGMNVSFVLESGFNTGTGSLDNAAGVLFNRSAWVGLGGAWGSVNFGRQYSINFKTIGLYDPFNYKYVATIPLATQGGLTRLNNDIQYTGTFGDQTPAAQAATSQAYPQYTGNLGRITIRAEYALGEQIGSNTDGAAQAIGVADEIGPFVFGSAYTERKNNVGPAGFQKQKNWTIGATYLAAPLRLAVGYADSKQATGTIAADTRVKDSWIGGSYSLSAATQLSLAYYRTQFTAATGNTDGRKNLFILGGTYNLSKRTNFYADIDSARFSGTAVSSAGNQNNQTGISVGINHLF